MRASSHFKSLRKDFAKKKGIADRQSVVFLIGDSMAGFSTLQTCEGADLLVIRDDDTPEKVGHVMTAPHLVS
jgi:hypothetical protein